MASRQRQRDITKRRFNVVLDIYNTDSWTGKQFDATFQVDLKRLVQNPEDLAKPYNVRFSYLSQIASFSTTGANPTMLFSLNIDMRRNKGIQNYNKPETYAGNLQNEYGGGSFIISRLIARPQDNPPFYVDNLTNLTDVRLETVFNSTGNIINPTNGSTINNVFKYIVYLHFEEA